MGGGGGNLLDLRRPRMALVDGEVGAVGGNEGG